MSRIAKASVAIPAGVEVALGSSNIEVKGKGGALTLSINPLVNITNNEGKLSFAPANNSRNAAAMAGTFRQLVNNMVKGVTDGFEKKLTLIGVGFRASASGNKLNMNVGFSHPVEFEMPEGISVSCPTPTEVVVKGADRQAVGQLAAEIRAVRPPEPYKGKGIRYVDEQVTIKETKKK